MSKHWDAGPSGSVIIPHGFTMGSPSPLPSGDSLELLSRTLEKSTSVSVDEFARQNFPGEEGAE